MSGTRGECWSVVRLSAFSLLADTDASGSARTYMVATREAQAAGRHLNRLGRLAVVLRETGFQVVYQDECAGTRAASVAAETPCDLAENGAWIVPHGSGERHRHERAADKAATGNMGPTKFGQR